MTFTNILFLFYFLPISLILYFLAPRKHRNFVLLFSSLFFCAWGEPVYFLVILLSTIISYLSGKKMLSTENEVKKKALLVFPLVINVIAFLCLKFLHHSVATINPLSAMGVLFVTLKSVSFLVDVYKNKIQNKLSFVNFGTYVLMFPQIVVGPVEKYADFENQLVSRIGSIEKFSGGFIRFVVGLSKTVIISELMLSLYNSVNQIQVIELSVASSWLSAFSFGLYVYFALSGYSDMSVGLGKMFGFTYSENFDYPIFSCSVTDFWKRWFKSIALWFNEYLITPFAGKSKIRYCLIFLISSILTGIIYGHSVNFILWCVYIALVLMLEHVFILKIIKRLPKFLKMVYTLFFVTIGWALFSGKTPYESVLYIKAMFGGLGNATVSESFVYNISTNIIPLAVAILATMPFGAKTGRKYVEKNPVYAIFPICIAILLCLAYILA